MYSIKQKGMTLIELTVVLLILVALAGLALPYVSGTSRKALCDATDVSMMNIKQVIMQRYYLDTLGAFPVDKGNTDYSLHYLFSKGDGTGTDWSNFDLDSQVGWNGPYLQNGMILDAINLGQLDSSFTNAGDGHVNRAFAENDNIVLDAWGRPFVLQVDSVTSGACTNWGGNTTDVHCARLVSAGFGSGVGMGNGSIETLLTGTQANDDRILYLNVPRPVGDSNRICD